MPVAVAEASPVPFVVDERTPVPAATPEATAALVPVVTVTCTTLVPEITTDVIVLVMIEVLVVVGDAVATPATVDEAVLVEFNHGAITHCEANALSTYWPSVSVGVKLRTYEVAKLPAAQAM